MPVELGGNGDLVPTSQELRADRLAGGAVDRPLQAPRVQGFFPSHDVASTPSPCRRSASISTTDLRLDRRSQLDRPIRAFVHADQDSDITVAVRLVQGPGKIGAARAIDPG